jgi:hypothetical protein
MTVILSSIGRVKPGRYPEFLSQAADASKLYQRLGARPPRLLSAGLAGEALGTWTFAVEFDDLDSFGAISDKFQADSEAQAFQMRLAEESNPSTIEQVNVAVELPLRQSRGGRGNVVAVYASKPQPGALERALELGARASAFAEGRGALDARMYNLIASGSGTGVYLSMWELENLRAYASIIDAFQNDAEGQAIAATSAAGDSPVVTLFEAVYTEIPI